MGTYMVLKSFKLCAKIISSFFARSTRCAQTLTGSKDEIIFAQSFKASAPGTLMLLGEHAVLNDKPAIVLAIDKRITVTLRSRLDQKMLIVSDLGKIALELHEIEKLSDQKPFHFVFAAIKYFKEELKTRNQGFELIIDSEFSPNCGLGSSAAVTVALIAVLLQLLSKNREKLFEISRKIIREVQGVGSGADVAASIYGGVIVYQQQPPYIIKKLDSVLPLVVMYSGSKTPTPVVIKKVEALQNKYPDVVNRLYDAIEHMVNRASVFLENQDWIGLGEVMNIQQGVMNALGVGTPVLNQLIDGLNSAPGIYGAKISGSGLGDCVIGLGAGCDKILEIEALGNGIQKIPLSVSLQGVRYG
jgi:mevalonate kinase